MAKDFISAMTCKRLEKFLATTRQTHSWVFDRLSEILSHKHSNILPA